MFFGSFVDVFLIIVASEAGLTIECFESHLGKPEWQQRYKRWVSARRSNLSIIPWVIAFAWD